MNNQFDYTLRVEFKELPRFSEIIGDLLTDERYSKLQEELIENPEKGDLIQGTGGARKIRVAMQGRGKSGGMRVIYYFQAAHTIHFLAAYPKNKKGDLTGEDRKAIAAIIQSIKRGVL